jgi:hypothetical protein
MQSSIRAGRRAGLGAPLAAALALLAATTRWFGHGHDLDLLRCLAFLLTATLVSAVDDPTHETLAAVPFSLAARTLGRVAVAALTATAVWVAALTVAVHTTRHVPLFWMTVEATGIAVVGVTCAVLVQRWGHLDEPAVVAIPAVLALLLSMQVIPREWALLGDQTWGPPWIATRIRWASLIAIATGLTSCALAQRRASTWPPRQRGVGTGDQSGARPSC